MKICLINPPIEDFYTTSIRRQPLGLLYIASALRKAGYEPYLLNCHSKKKSPMAIPSEFSYLKEFIDNSNSEFAFPFFAYSHYGMSWQEIEQRIKNIDADLWLISSLFTTYYEEVDRIIEIIRKFSKTSAIALGGYHATLHSWYYLENENVDFIIRGEGELSSTSLANFLSRGEPLDNGIIQCGDSSTSYSQCMSSNFHIDEIPIPARDLLLARDWRAYKKNFFSMITSRGCPNRCEFCTGKIIWGNSYRVRSIDSIIDEIDLCVREFNASIINFEDDNLFASRSRARDLLSEIIKYKKVQGCNVEFTAMNGISIEQIDEDIISLMAMAGFKELNISLVSFSGDMQRKNKRPFDSLKFKKIAEFAKRLGLNVRGFFIMGMPSQTREEIKETIDFMQSLEISVFPSVFYNVFSPKNEWKMQRSSAFYNETESLTRRDLIRFFNLCQKML